MRDERLDVAMRANSETSSESHADVLESTKARWSPPHFLCSPPHYPPFGQMYFSKLKREQNYFSKLTNVFDPIAKCNCINLQLYLFKLSNVFATKLATWFALQYHLERARFTTLILRELFSFQISPTTNLIFMVDQGVKRWFANKEPLKPGQQTQSSIGHKNNDWDFNQV